MARTKRPKLHGNPAEDAMLRGLDKLAGYENYRRDVAPHIKKALSEGWDVDRLLSSFKELAAAKLIEKALNGEGKDQLAALKEVLDRTQGKPTEKVEIRTKYDKMSDKELDALLTSKMKEIKAP